MTALAYMLVTFINGRLTRQYTPMFIGFLNQSANCGEGA